MSPTTGSPPQFKLRVERNLVLVRAVVADSHGQPVRDLTKNDFRLLDNGKPQDIIEFSTEGGNERESGAVPGTATPAFKPPPASATTIPDHFVALYFDDIMMSFPDVVHTRDAAERFLKSSLAPDDRVGVFTSSGQGELDFTTDRDKLHDALFRLKPRSPMTTSGRDCPDLTDYEAYLIDQINDPTALQIATEKVIQCMCGGNPQTCTLPATVAKNAARMRWEQAENQLLYSLRGLDQVVRRLAVRPGRRSVLFISSGFIATTQLQLLSGIIDRAAGSGEVINALDSRGLVALMPGGDVSQPTSSVAGQFQAQLDQMALAAAQKDDDVLAEVADGTGGVFFHNSNDYDGGFRAAGGLPQLSYLLAFTPSQLKLDGKYHHLKVELVGDARRRAATVQARRGYFAPKKALSEAQEAEQEIKDEVFSHDQMEGLPIRLETSFSKSGSGQAQLSVTAYLDAKPLHFVKQGE
ncbi:MAG: VWA domain-containing protein [Terriglobia bacterium]